MNFTKMLLLVSAGITAVTFFKDMTFRRTDFALEKPVAMTAESYLIYHSDSLTYLVCEQLFVCCSLQMSREMCVGSVDITDLQPAVCLCFKTAADTIHPKNLVLSAAVLELEFFIINYFLIWVRMM